MRDLYLLVTIDHSHANFDQMAPRVWAQLFLYRVRTWRGVLFSKLDNPLAWFQLSAAYAGIVWLLFIYDMRLISARISESNNDADRALYDRARADQLLNIWVLVPLLFLLNIGCAFAIWRWPDVFITRAGHVWLIGIQLVSFVIYLVYIARYFNAIAPLLQRSREGAGER